ncbi:hypothetical protein AGMMS49545_23920 [Betaproteobacteria bacterium]|nr:hypothetical protein AGMMS49545_23920 [Betaproteobacteria bacterium]GHU49143.1 hypothetical protein AGMMS50289_26170 [Betaproteobacteria bacterium]
MDTPDKKALKILLEYHPAFPENTSQEDMTYMRSHGLAFDIKEMTHDELVKWAIEEYKKCSKKKITDSFLRGLGRNQPQLRAALSAYAIMTKFPEHTYQTITGNECGICGGLKIKEIDRTFLNAVRFACGSVIGSAGPECFAFFLNKHNHDECSQSVTSDDIEIFSDIINIIMGSEGSEKPLTLYKKIRKTPGVKMNIEQARCFLDLLGHTGILQTSEHQGFIYKYTNLGLAKTSSRSSDWSYPVDFWRGEDGINKDAFLYWFGDYPDLSKLMV